MKKFLLICMFLVCYFYNYNLVNAQRGCCSHHGGVSSSCTSSGYIVCNDGTTSPSCTCTPNSDTSTYNTQNNYIPIYGCMDQNAINYNSNANEDNGSCEYETITISDEVIKTENTYDDEPSEEEIENEEKEEIDEDTNDNNSLGLIATLGIAGIVVHSIRKKK